MSGRFAIVGLTALAFLVFGAGAGLAPSKATAEFRVPGLFGGKPAVKRKRYRAPRPVQPSRNPDRVFATVSAKAVSPEVAKNSDAVLGVGTTSAASVALALPAPRRTAAKDEDPAPSVAAEANADEAKADESKADESKADESKADEAKTDESDTAETASQDTKSAETETADTETADSETPDSELADTKTADAQDDASSADEVASAADTGTARAETETEVAGEADPKAESKTELAADSEDESQSVADMDSEPSSESKTSSGSKTADSEADTETDGDSKTASSDSKPDETASATDGADTAAASDAAPNADTRADDAKSGDVKASETKTADAETGDDATTGDDAKATETSDANSGDASSGDAKSNETEPTETKAADAGTGESADNKDADKEAATDVSDAGGAKTADEKTADEKTADAKSAAAASDESDAAEATLADKTDEIAVTSPSDVGTAAAATAAAVTAAALAAKAEADGSTEAADTSEAESAEADADSAEVAADAGPVPPAPQPKPEAVRLANKTGVDAKDESGVKDGAEAETKAEADTETDTKTASDVVSEPEADPVATASIAPASAPSSTAQSAVPADVTDVARAADAPAAAAPKPDPRAYNATVVLDVSPPPGSEEPDVEETQVAALSPGSALVPDDGTAAEDEPPADNAVDVGPPPPPPVDPVIASVRSKLEGPAAPKVAAADLEALKTLYGERDDEPFWVTEDGLTSGAKVLIATIQDADDWGLDAGAYAVPDPNAALATDEARADAELALSAAALKYARHAQTGRLTPSRAHKLFDYNPKARDPKTVLTGLAASETPDKALLALHPQSEQYQRLHAALVHARDTAQGLGRNPDNDRNVQRIVINMERWRWLPSDLGSFHVWNNIPEFQFRVFKGGREIYREKSIVGQVKYATPFFSAPMRNIVFNPNWTVPPTIVKEDIAPKLKGPRRSGGLFSGPESRNRMLSRYGLTVSKGGKPVDADAVDWQTANVHTYTFTQDPGPHNVLGQFKFNFPNSHAIYMHDTTQKELFSRQTRTLSHGCIRVNQPARFAALLLGEDKGWSMGTVQDVLARAQGQTKVIALNRNIPVHLTYNTAVADSYGSIQEFGDVYGIDNQMAAKLFKNPAYFNVPYSADVAETSPAPRYSEPRPRRRRSANSVDDFISGILGN
ncbi:hypothetical protein AUC68_12095 [Methyloceanibacter methanicus]|uniref:L,D-TPase catalytic domain-containing protein n=1 Tax=Methyloceanibacter methanicus TaxID=1774968 RepID=A0A1E3W5M4_9HYPH|nr:L,D-transpeptidase family protein [Methyloceanibacter methanicus]ODS01113.1 hypothetical protein AUC68_12095 [Methyloceanibacter methanicus]